MRASLRKIVALAISCMALGLGAAERDAPPLSLGYTAFFVENVPQTVAFYQAAFGIPLKYMHPSQGYAELRTGATLLAFIGEAFTAEQRLLGDAKLRTNRATADPIAAQLAFVSSDIGRDWSRAVQAGAKVLKSPEPKPWGQTVGYLLDPNGIIVELCTPPTRK